jgi:hypothetical protein
MTGSRLRGAAKSIEERRRQKLSLSIQGGVTGPWENALGCGKQEKVIELARTFFQVDRLAIKPARFNQRELRPFVTPR